MAKTRVPRKSKKVAEAPIQPVAPEPVKEAPKPAPVKSEAEQKEDEELAAIKAQAQREVAEATECYNREEIPKLKKRLDEAFKKLPKKASTEQVLAAFFEAMNDGKENVSW